MTMHRRGLPSPFECRTHTIAGCLSGGATLATANDTPMNCRHSPESRRRRQPKVTRIRKPPNARETPKGRPARDCAAAWPEMPAVTGVLRSRTSKYAARHDKITANRCQDWPTARRRLYNAAARPVPAPSRCVTEQVFGLRSRHVPRRRHSGVCRVPYGADTTPTLVK